MGKMLGCKNCQDLVLLHTEGDFRKNPRTCYCGACHGFAIPGQNGVHWHALLFGPAIAFGIENDDKDQAFKGYAEKDKDRIGVEGYYAVRVHRIPDGDRIIIASKTDNGWEVTTRCWRCGMVGPPCEFLNIDLKKYESS